MKEKMEPEHYKKLLDHLFDGVYYVTPDMKITYWNKSAEKITGYTPKEVEGYPCSQNILRHINDNGDELCVKGCPVLRTLQDGKIREADVYLHHKEGHRVPVCVRVTPIRDPERNVIGAVEIFSENSQKLSLLEEMESLKSDVYIDRLSGIGNRRYAELNIHRCINEWNVRQIPFGLLFFDIDDFKKINDTYGHAVGDKVLKMVARTTDNVLRSLDTVCRWGGDEFIVILPNVDMEAMQKIAEKIRLFIESNWIDINKKTIRTSLSVGGTLAQKNETLIQLIDRADLQMYRAKKLGKNTVEIN